MSTAVKVQDARVATLTESAEQALDDHEAAYTKLVTATEALALLKGQRATRKAEAVVRLRQQGYSESTAKDFAQLDKEYSEYKADVGRAEVNREEALHETENAKLRAELYVGLAKAGVR
jgi:hypothetical protein